jgi:transposase
MAQGSPGGRPRSRPHAAKNTYLAARYRRLVIRRGRRRALVALQRSMLITIWQMFTNDIPYHDLSAAYFVDRASKTITTRRLIGQLNHLGYHVKLRQAVVS